MSIFEDSEDENFLQPLQSVNIPVLEKKDNNLILKTLKTKKPLKKIAIAVKYKKKKEPDVIKTTAIKEKKLKAYIDIEKSDGKFNFCESLVQDITINKKDSFRHDGTVFFLIVLK